MRGVFHNTVCFGELLIHINNLHSAAHRLTNRGDTIIKKKKPFHSM